MTTEPHAAPVDVALDLIAELIGQPRLGTIEDVVTTLRCAVLWREVYEGAMQRADGEVAALAAEEHRHALERYRQLTGSSRTDTT